MYETGGTFSFTRSLKINESFIELVQLNSEGILVVIIENNLLTSQQTDSIMTSSNPVPYFFSYKTEFFPF